MPSTFTYDCGNALQGASTDCGFESSESPALRGFVGGRWSQATTFLYLAQNRTGSMMQKSEAKSCKNGDTKSFVSDRLREALIETLRRFVLTK